MNGTRGRQLPRIAWDSCVFLAWFQEEADKNLGNIELIVQALDAGRINLVCSTICAAEVLNRAGESDAGTQFSNFVKRTNVILADVDMRVAERAARCREKATLAVGNRTIARGVKAPDAIIVATALIYKADVLHTFDPDLLSLSASPILDGLQVSQPILPSGQQGLPV